MDLLSATHFRVRWIEKLTGHREAIAARMPYETKLYVYRDHVKRFGNRLNVYFQEPSTLRKMSEFWRKFVDLSRTLRIFTHVGPRARTKSPT
jgi:hypothetical protein